MIISNLSPTQAILIQTDGTEITMNPRNGTDFQLEELYELLKCELIEICLCQASGQIARANRDYILIIDEEGKLKNRERNDKATEWYSSPVDVIVGPAILCHTDMLR